MEKKQEGQETAAGKEMQYSTDTVTEGKPEGAEKVAGKVKLQSPEKKEVESKPEGPEKTVTEGEQQEPKEMAGKEEYKMPDEIGRRMWNIALRLLADQENVEIGYELIVCEDRQEKLNLNLP